MASYLFLYSSPISLREHCGHNMRYKKLKQNDCINNCQVIYCFAQGVACKKKQIIY